MITRTICYSLWVAGILGFGAVQCLAADDAPAATQPVNTTAPASQPATDGVAQLVAQLSSPEWKTRRAAQEQLAKMGLEAEETLREMAGRSSLDEDARKGIDVVLGRIEAERKRAESLVSLKYTAAKPSEVYASLGSQANIELAPGMSAMLDRLEAQSIDVDIDKASFWKSLLQLNKQCGLVFDQLDSTGRVQLVPAAAGVATMPAVTTGPILTTINRVEVDAGRSIDFGGHRPMNARRQGNNEATCKMFLFTWCEPKLKPLDWSIEAIDACETDTGQTLKTRFRGEHVAGRINNINDTQLQLVGDLDKAKTIRKLRMTAMFNLELDRQTLEVPNILAVHNGTYQLGDFRMVINSVNKMADDRYGYELKIFRDGNTAVAWTAMRDMADHAGFKLVDADGNALGFSGGGMSTSPNEIGMHGVLTCDARNGVKAGPPVKFVWSYASKVQHIAFPLNFTDIPLP